MLHLKSLGTKAAIGALALFFCLNAIPGLIVRAEGQRLPGRVRRPPVIPPGAVLVPTPAPRLVPASPLLTPQAPINAAPASLPLQPSAPASLPPSLLEKPAQPAQIEFSSGTLSIRADNSSLGAILNALSARSGMHIEGLGGDERVFGNFGPGTPRAVLSDLLNGTSYNILMVGDLSNGAPRQLILSPVTPDSTSSPEPQPTQTADANQDQGQQDSQPPAPPRPGYYPPGANPGLPNSGASNPNAGAPSDVVKTPQQLFQELQQLRQQRLQGQQQQN